MKNYRKRILPCTDREHCHHRRAGRNVVEKSKGCLEACSRATFHIELCDSTGSE